MFRAFIFIVKYRILSNPSNLSRYTKEFFKLSKVVQRRVLNRYFDKLENSFDIDSCFGKKSAFYYEDGKEISFYNCYYFDKLILEHDILNIRLIDKFKLDDDKINYLISYALTIIKEDKILLSASDLVNYDDNLPVRLSMNINFMRYLVERDYTCIKYIVYNELCSNKQRDLIRDAIKVACEKSYQLEVFLKRDKTLPDILLRDCSFIFYLIKNDICNIKYLKSNFLDNLTISDRKNLVDSIIFSFNNSNLGMEYIEKFPELFIFLSRNEVFINYIIERDVNNIGYVDWHNLSDNSRNNIINNVVRILINNGDSLDIMKYSFRDLFFANYSFMDYLIHEDFRWVAVSLVNSKEDNDKLIDLFFELKDKSKYKFKLVDFLVDGCFLNVNLIENKRMMHYLFVNGVPLVQHIDFFSLKSARMVVDNLVDELEKTGIDYNFSNNDFLIDGKYPVVLSNSYRFMRYVIDKNFNYISYMDISMIDKRELKRIINYAFRMVYYIRGHDKSLNFDFDGYFQNSPLLENEYFKECLKSL